MQQDIGGLLFKQVLTDVVLVVVSNHSSSGNSNSNFVTSDTCHSDCVQPHTHNYYNFEKNLLEGENKHESTSSSSSKYRLYQSVGEDEGEETDDIEEDELHLDDDDEVYDDRQEQDDDFIGNFEVNTGGDDDREDRDQTHSNYHQLDNSFLGNSSTYSEQQGGEAEVSGQLGLNSNFGSLISSQHQSNYLLSSSTSSPAAATTTTTTDIGVSGKSLGIPFVSLGNSNSLAATVTSGIDSNLPSSNECQTSTLDLRFSSSSSSYSCFSTSSFNSFDKQLKSDSFYGDGYSDGMYLINLPKLINL